MDCNKEVEDVVPLLVWKSMTLFSEIHIIVLLISTDKFGIDDY